MEKLRIAIWHNLPTGGGKRQLYNHVKGLLERGHYLEAWCPDTAVKDYLTLNTLIKENVVPLDLPPNSEYTGKDSKTVRALIRAMEKHCEACGEQINAGGFDVLFANSCFIFRTTPIAKYVDIPSAIYLGEPYRNFYEALPELPWIAPAIQMDEHYSWRSITDHLKSVIRLDGIRLQARFELEFAKEFDAIFVNSRFSRESVLRAYGLESKICYLGIDTEHYRPTLEPKEEYVIGVGYIYHGKGIDRAIRAIGTIHEEKRPALLWVGDNASQSDLKSYESLARELGVNFSPKIHISDEELIGLLSRAKAMIYTSRLEPFGLAPLEANACGTPVVGIAEGGIKETIRNGINGFLSDDDDPEVLGGLISKFIDEPELSCNMGLRASEFVKENWGLGFCTDNIEVRLRQLISRKGTKHLSDFLKGALSSAQVCPSGELKMHVDELKIEGSRLRIRGWAFIDDRQNTYGSKIFLVLKNDSHIRVIQTVFVKRPDVTEYFENKFNLDYSGFSADVKINSCEDLSIGILIERQGKICYRFIER